MSRLIVIEPKQIGNQEVNAVDARELHGNLGVKKKFADWIKYNIEKLTLIEGTDYITLPKIGTGGQFDSIEYLLTLDAGKHIAMMAGTEKAHEVRTYFIEFEKAHKNQPVQVVHDPKTQALIQALVKIDSIEHEQARQLTMIESVNGRLDDLSPAMTSQTLFTIYGRIAQVAKVHREVMELNRRRITAAVAKQDITAELLCKFDIHDLAYAKDTKALFKYLDYREKQLLAEREELWPSEGLFKKAA